MAKTMAVIVATARAMVMASATAMAKAIMVVAIRWGIAQTCPRQDGWRLYVLLAQIHLCKASKLAAVTSQYCRVRT